MQNAPLIKIRRDLDVLDRTVILVCNLGLLEFERRRLRVKRVLWARCLETDLIK